VPAGERSEIKQVELRLRRSVPNQRIQLGNAELRLVGQYWAAGLMEEVGSNRLRVLMLTQDEGANLSDFLC
jgi:hypothetical protein